MNKFKYRGSPIAKACKSIEELEKKLISSYLGAVGVEFDNVDTAE